MATTLRHITLHAPSARPPAPVAPAENPSPSAGALGPPPVGLCDECEYGMWGCYQAADPNDETAWKSPHRHAREASEAGQSYPFTCEGCGRTIQAPADEPTARPI
jgi:hypothetical protein